MSVSLTTPISLPLAISCKHSQIALPPQPGSNRPPSVLFIVSVLAAVWALATLFRRESTYRSASFVAFVDLCFVGALIAGVYQLRDIQNYNCLNVVGSPVTYTGSVVIIDWSPYVVDLNKACTMLKASWAFGIMNCIFFFITFLISVTIHRAEHGVVVEKTTYRRRSHDSR